ncbi:MAG: hypothetical protein H8K05_12840 [Nitrospira sp.]|nr:hypothetical protein [Nitrospira sp.]
MTQPIRELHHCRTFPLFYPSDLRSIDRSIQCGSDRCGCARSLTGYLTRIRIISARKATVAYLKGLADEIGMPYQSLTNLYLRDCALNQKKLDLMWDA